MGFGDWLTANLPSILGFAGDILGNPGGSPGGIRPGAPTPGGFTPSAPGTPSSPGSTSSQTNVAGARAEWRLAITQGIIPATMSFGDFLRRYYPHLLQGGVPAEQTIPSTPGSSGFQPAGGSDIDDPLGFSLGLRQPRLDGNGQGPPELDGVDINPFDGRTVDDEALQFLMLFGKDLTLPEGVPLRNIVRLPVVYRGPNGAVRYGSLNGYKLVRKRYKGEELIRQVWKPIADKLLPRRGRPLITSSEARILRKADAIENKVKKVAQRAGFHVYEEARSADSHEHHIHHTHPVRHTHEEHHHK